MSKESFHSCSKTSLQYNKPGEKVLTILKPHFILHNFSALSEIIFSFLPTRRNIFTQNKLSEIHLEATLPSVFIEKLSELRAAWFIVENIQSTVFLQVDNHQMKVGISILAEAIRFFCTVICWWWGRFYVVVVGYQLPD